MNDMSKKYAVPILIMIAATVISLVWYEFETKKANALCNTGAVITDTETYVSLKESRIRYTYSYEVNGAKYSSTDDFPLSADACEIGDTVTVWYDPDSPDGAVMNKSTVLYLFAPMFLGAPLAVGVYGLLSKSEKRNSL